MKVGLKGQLRALLTYRGVVGVVQGLIDIVPLGPAHQPHPAQQVGGVGGVVFPDGGGVNIDPGEIGLLYLHNEGHLHILGKDIGVVGHLPGAERELIAHAHQSPGLVVGQKRVYLIVSPQLVQKGVGAGIADPLALLRSGPDAVGLLPLWQGAGPFQAAGKGVEVADGAGAGGVKGKNKGGLGGYRECIGPGDALLPTDVQELEKGGIGILHKGGIQAHIVALTVGDQHPSVTVQNLSPGRLHRLGLGDLSP